MKRRIALTTWLLAAAAVLALVLPASANWSDNNIAYTRGYLQATVTMLQGDNRDYDGHRAAAIQHIQNAQNYLAQALAYDASHTRQANPTLLMPSGVNSSMTRQQSNDDIRAAIGYVGHAISMLQGDQKRYGGFRVKAVNELQAAQSELNQALRFNTRTGSNSSMRFVRWYVERAIGQLQGGTKTYGGHRVSAIKNLQTAREQILTGLRIATNNNYSAESAVQPPNAIYQSEARSDAMLRNVRDEISQAISMLQNDSATYGGYRMKAISSLQSASYQLNLALQYSAYH
jgi:hypothetical protein